MSYINEIRNFLKKFNVSAEDPNTDIFKEMGVTGDDFRGMIEKYAKQYEVDMSDYLEYFHSEEEAFNSIGGPSFKSTYEQVRRIPVTPQMLADFIVTKKWQVNYPPHEIPKQPSIPGINSLIQIKRAS